MTPLRAAVLLALEQECRHLAVAKIVHGLTDQYAVRYGAFVADISSRINYPGLVRSAVIRKVLHEEAEAGRVLHENEGAGTAHRWWPVGLMDKLAEERTQAQREWNADLVLETEALRVTRHLSREAAEQLARTEVVRRRGPCP